MSVKIECDCCGQHIVGMVSIRGEHEYYVNGSRHFHWCKECAAVVMELVKSRRQSFLGS